MAAVPQQYPRSSLALGHLARASLRVGHALCSRLTHEVAPSGALAAAAINAHEGVTVTASPSLVSQGAVPVSYPQIEADSTQVSTTIRSAGLFPLYEVAEAMERASTTGQLTLGAGATVLGSNFSQAFGEDTRLRDDGFQRVGPIPLGERWMSVSDLSCYSLLSVEEA